MYLKYFFSSISFFIISIVYANPNNGGSVSGVVMDAATHNPMPGAIVSIPDLKVSAVTDANGRYIFKSLPYGTFTFLISHMYYKSKAVNVVISGVTEQNFLLQSSAVENENVTVTGISSATQLKRMPMQISIVSRKSIEQSTGSTLLDAITKEPGVSIVTTGPAIAKPFIRGLGYNRVVSINDGIRQEGQQWGDEHGLEMDEYSTQKIEILRGPASLMYGSDGLGGVINVLTNVPVASNTMQATILSSYNSNNSMWGKYANIAGNKNGFNWNAYGSFKNAKDYKNKYDGDVLNSRFNEKNWGGYIGLNKRWGYSHLIFSHFDQKIGMIEGERDDSGNLVLDGYELDNELITSRSLLVPYQSVQHFKVALDNSFSLKAGGRITALIGLQRNQRREFGDVKEPHLPEAYFDLKTINYHFAYQLPQSNNWKTSIGVNGMRQQNTNRAEEALIPNYSLWDLGVYTVVAKTWDQTTISGGGRFDTRSLNSRALYINDDEKFTNFKKQFSNISVSLGATHNISDHVTIKANIGRGFRAPNISELAANGEHEGTNRYEIGNRELHSEVSTSVDWGLEVTTSHIDFSVAPFYNRINDYIFYNKVLTSGGVDSLIDGAQVFQFNQQHANLLGIETRLDVHPHPLDWLHFENTFSWVKGTFTTPVDGSYNLPLIAPAKLITELRGEFQHVSKVFSNLYVKFEINTVSTQHRYFSGYDTETKTNGYVLLNSGIGSDIRIGGKNRCSIHLSLNNINDVAYQSHLSRLKYTDENPLTGRSGVYNMGRNFTARVLFPFYWKL